MKRIPLTGGPLDGAYINKKVSRDVVPGEVLAIWGHPDGPPMPYQVHPSGRAAYAPDAEGNHHVHVRETEY